MHVKKKPTKNPKKEKPIICSIVFSWINSVFVQSANIGSAQLWYLVSQSHYPLWNNLEFWRYRFLERTLRRWNLVGFFFPGKNGNRLRDFSPICNLRNGSSLPELLQLLLSIQSLSRTLQEAAPALELIHSPKRTSRTQSACPAESHRQLLLEEKCEPGS